MDSKLLIDSIVRQTTVLIAELSTAAGIRAPLAHLADQVFVSLAREIEAQGVGRKVVADMFGLALRTYQRKVQRLTESATMSDRTLWEAVLEFLQQGVASRERIRERFRHDVEEDVGAVLNDLVTSGLVYSTGRAESAVYGLASVEDQRAVSDKQSLDGLANMIWQRVFVMGGASASSLAAEFPMDEARRRLALDTLLADGRLVEASPEVYHASNFVLPVGATQGWEAAVFDHFSAMAQAIASKLQSRAERGKGRDGAFTREDDQVGGGTLTFTVYPGHPEEQEVLGLLARFRTELDELWQRVAQHNRTRPIVWENSQQVRFYFGQDVRPSTAPANLGDVGAGNGEGDQHGESEREARGAHGPTTATEQDL
jgi:hypothetical protein